jgi:hypothetical protein
VNSSPEEIIDINRQLDAMFNGEDIGPEHIISDPNVVFGVKR